MDDVATLRAFNRCYTQRIGVLDESFLGTGRPLGPSRVLYEIGAQGANIAELRRRLGLDSGYLSRMLRRLEQENLVEITADSADGRQRIVRLSRSGWREWRRLDRRSDNIAKRLIEPLVGRQREQLISALATAERLLRAATVTFDEVDPRGADAQAALTRYFIELDTRFGSGFDARAAGAEDTDGMRRPRGAFVLLRSDHVTVGCGGVQYVDDHTGEIKRMWVDPDWRGEGLGRRLLGRLETAARGLGRSRVVLDTNETLTEAIRMYQRAGYQPIERYNDNPYAHHWFAKQL